MFAVSARSVNSRCTLVVVGMYPPAASCVLRTAALCVLCRVLRAAWCMPARSSAACCSFGGSRNITCNISVLYRLACSNAACCIPHGARCVSVFFIVRVAVHADAHVGSHVAAHAVQGLHACRGYATSAGQPGPYRSSLLLEHTGRSNVSAIIRAGLPRLRSLLLLAACTDACTDMCLEH